MLYPKNREERLSNALFRNPTSEYRGTPFWAWNGKLEDDTLSEQIEMFRKMGFGGFHMHVRTGMDSPYLDDEFMRHVAHCIREAKENGMLAYLYDEDRWPSGTAGGKVTRANREFAAKMLLFTPFPYEPSQPNAPKGSEPGRGMRTMRMDNGALLAVYDILLNDDGTLKSSRLIGEDDAAAGDKWYAYIESAEPDPWFNDAPYVDTLNPDAIRAFIDTTHEAYYTSFKDDFGKTVPSIFTDEPQFATKSPLAFAAEKKDVFFPWTKGLPALYAARYDGETLLDKLPLLVWEQADGRLSRFRYRFHNLIAERFASTFCEQIGAWCESHDIALTGHVNAEPTLHSQTLCVGDAMRCYPHFGIPGIDMLCDWHEYNTAKQAQSVVRQDGKEGMLSELYGVTGWDYDFRGYKLQGDWQAALGVTVRVPHLSWMTMKGEAKRDYPATISYQSPWWQEYSVIENHFSRLNTALTRGKADVKVAVVHPIESYWLLWGPSQQTAAQRQQMDERFARLTESLLFGLIDFDFLSEACLPNQCDKASFPLRVGQMEYDCVVVCGSKTLRRTTLDILYAFRAAGGHVLFVDDCPECVDAEYSEDILPLYEASDKCAFDPAGILAKLAPYRALDIYTASGTRAESFLYQLRDDGADKWLFIANGKNPVSPDVERTPKYRFILKGEYALTVYDTLTGAIEPLPARYQDGNTVFGRTWYMHDSLLLRLEKGRGTAVPISTRAQLQGMSLIMKPVDISLSEPNMLLLDMAEYCVDGGDWQPIEELLRLDNAARHSLGIPLRRKEITQPYMLKEEVPSHTLRLRFSFASEIALDGAKLALEDAKATTVFLNGKPVPVRPDGWFVDKSIETMPLPRIEQGTNVLEIEVPIGRRTNLECFYLLGDFGVEVRGIEKTVTAPVRKLGFGDVTAQRLPFYTGNIDYRFDVEADGDFLLRVPRYRGGLIRVFADGQDMGIIAFSPYALELKGLPKGRHEIVLRLYGTRQNGFAQLHHTPGVYFYQSPNSWRSTGDMWTYEYTFKPMGILKSPELYGTRGATYFTKPFNEPGAMDD
ncbi:MAG: hypothetical protein ACOYI8_03580 [Christensenellales bacterium]